MSDVSLDDLVERLAQVSHATWIFQGVRDYGKTLAECAGRERDPGQPNSEEELAEAKRMLDTVLAGGVLPEAYPVVEHDRERADFSLQELERAKVLRESPAQRLG